MMTQKRAAGFVGRPMGMFIFYYSTVNSTGSDTAWVAGS